MAVKYTNYAVTFAEIPDEVTLCINISGCPNRCKGCHSTFLQEDIGDILDIKKLSWLIEQNKGITCVCFMGGDNSPADIDSLAWTIKLMYTNLRTAWYSGRSSIPDDIKVEHFDYIKLGPYIEELGPLNVTTTNQRLYEIKGTIPIDITDRFWKLNSSYDPKNMS